jgi:tRNA(Ile)-lysidine synthase
MNWIDPDVSKESLPELLRARLEELGITRRQPWLLGFSGGGDSAALLHLLVRLGFESLRLCHFNHQLRGTESEEDARFAEGQAREHGLPVLLKTESAAVRAAEEKVGLEEAARHQRREFFAQCARETGSRGIFLAHHADDQAETCLHNLLRGSGPSGLAGMRPLSALTPPENGEGNGPGETLCCRPLLGVPQTVLREYVALHRVPCREDSSNQELDFTRNRLRHVLIPHLERELDRPVRQALLRLSEILREEDDLLRDLTAQTGLTVLDKLPVAALAALPVALQRRVLHTWLHFHGVRRVRFELVEQARELLDPTGGPAKINLASNRHLRRREMVLFIETTGDKQAMEK